LPCFTLLDSHREINSMPNQLLNGIVSEQQKNPSRWLQLRNGWTAIAGFTAIAAYLRLVGLNRGLWWDEIYFLIVTVRHPLAEIVTIFPGDTQHPLYSILAKWAVGLLGEHPWTLRLPAVVFGVASIPALYLLASAVTSRLEALLAAFLLTVSYHHVWFSQNARGYTMLAFWALLATYFLLRGIQTGRRTAYIAYGIVAGLGVYTHLTMAFLVTSHVVILAVWLLGGREREAGPKNWKLPLQGFLVAAGVGLILYAPILGQVQNYFVHRPSLMRAVSTPRWAFWETLRGLSLGFGTTAVVLGAGVVVALGAWSYWRQSRLVFALFALPGLFMFLGAVAARGTMYPRFYFFLLGFAILVLVRGVFALPRWVGRVAGSPGLVPVFTAVLAGALLAASGISLLRNYRYPKQDFAGALQFVESHRGAGENVATAGASTYPMREYYRRAWESIETAGKLEQLCREGRVVWLLYTFPRYLEAAVPGISDVIRRKFTVVHVFPGTIGDGDVYVARFQP
jgi:mannosyltransferase